MTNSDSPAIDATVMLRRPFDPTRDHFRGGGAPAGVMVLVLYGDYLCPYCRRLRHVLAKLRQVLGARFVYVFRHFPNERAHPGANFLASVAEASGKQGRFWEMHDWLYEQTPPIDSNTALRFAAALGLDMERFQRDLQSDETKAHIDKDLGDGRQNGVTATPTVFVDGHSL